MLNPNVGATQNIGASANALATPAIQANIAQNNALQQLALSKINSQQGFQVNANNIANAYGQMQQNAADPLNAGNLVGDALTLTGGFLPSILGPQKSPKLPNINGLPTPDGSNIGSQTIPSYNNVTLPNS